MIEVRGKRIGLHVEGETEVAWVREDEIVHVAKFGNKSVVTLRTPYFEIECSDGLIQHKHQVFVSALAEDILAACMEAQK